MFFPSRAAPLKIGEPLKRGALVALCLAVAMPAGAQQSAFDTYLNAAIRLYESLEYERALEQIDKAKKLSRGVDDDVVLAFYEGVVKMDLGQVESAQAAFKTALLLKPDAAIPLKVSPKVRTEVESLRAQVKKELAPMIARQDADRKKKEDEDARVKSEDARKADLAKNEELRKAAEAKNEEARRRSEEELAKKKVTHEPARVTNDARQVELVPKDVPPDVVTPPVVKSRKVPLVPFVFLGVGVAAAATATYFGLTSQQQVSAARTTLFQDDRSSQLRGAQTNATVANVLFAVTAVAGIGALIGFILGFSGEESP